jgi:hypothetical protein
MNLRQFSGDPKRLSRGGGSQSGMWFMQIGSRRRQSRSSSAPGIPVLYTGMCALEDHAGGAGGG